MSKDIESIAEEFLQVSSHLRLGVLLHLLEKNDNLSSLTKILDVTGSEMHRNLKRMSDANLISKNNEGQYTLRSYGKMVCAMVSSWEFVTSNSKYFITHEFGMVPQLFLQSIGSLNNSKHVQGFVNVQDIWKKIYSNATKYIHNILFEVSYDSEILSIITSQLNKGVNIYSIFLEDAILPESRKKVIGNKDIISAIQEQILIRRTIKDINTLVVLNEKEAFVMFPKSDGKIDVSEGFYSNDKNFHHWCLEYFDYCLNSSGSFFEERLK
jgi:predicted transcriptional regulator